MCMLMCMCMLTKRAQILFDQDLWQKLNSLAKKEKKSVGEVVRVAVKEKYQREQELAERARAVDYILEHRPHFKGKIDYKALINEGRKY